MFPLSLVDILLCEDGCYCEFMVLQFFFLRFWSFLFSMVGVFYFWIVSIVNFGFCSFLAFFADVFRCHSWVFSFFRMADFFFIALDSLEFSIILDLSFGLPLLMIFSIVSCVYFICENFILWSLRFFPFHCLFWLWFKLSLMGILLLGDGLLYALRVYLDFNALRLFSCVSFVSDSFHCSESVFYFVRMIFVVHFWGFRSLFMIFAFVLYRCIIFLALGTLAT